MPRTLGAAALPATPPPLPPGLQHLESRSSTLGKEKEKGKLEGGSRIYEPPRGGACGASDISVFREGLGEGLGEGLHDGLDEGTLSCARTGRKRFPGSNIVMMGAVVMPDSQRLLTRLRASRDSG